MVKHQFGGEWTEEKLTCLKKYLEAYRKIFSKNPKASFFTTHYVDAFAGSGFRNVKENDDPSEINSFSLFDEEDTEEVETFLKGSVQTALEISNPFDHYLFIDNNPKFIQELEKTKENHPNLKEKIDVELADANKVLEEWCEKIDWSKNRAVLFIDPYGMQVNWDVIEVIAETEAIDLWLLFPLGVAVNRLLVKGKLPPTSWGDALTRTFGTADWKLFYNEEKRPTLFGEEISIKKTATLRDIEEFLIERLKEIFPAVVETPLRLYNSRNNPIYLLCFAAANEKGGKTAVKIAEDIIGKVCR